LQIAKEVHYARALNYRRIEIDKVISFTNNQQGFKTFKNWVFEIILKSQNTTDTFTMLPIT